MLARKPIGAYPYRTGKRQGQLAPSGPCLGGGDKTGVQLQRLLRRITVRVAFACWLHLAASFSLWGWYALIRFVSSLPTIRSERLHYSCLVANAVPNQTHLRGGRSYLYPSRIARDREQPTFRRTRSVAPAQSNSRSGFSFEHQVSQRSPCGGSLAHGNTGRHGSLPHAGALRFGRSSA